jgi:hypothetical protein
MICSIGGERVFWQGERGEEGMKKAGRVFSRPV